MKYVVSGSIYHNDMALPHLLHIANSEGFPLCGNRGKTGWFHTDKETNRDGKKNPVCARCSAKEVAHALPTI